MVGAGFGVVALIALAMGRNEFGRTSLVVSLGIFTGAALLGLFRNPGDAEASNRDG